MCGMSECALDLEGGESDSLAPQDPRVWYPAGPGHVLALQSGRLVDYDTETLSPVGIVFLGVGK